jgi:hypothetical protein
MPEIAKPERQARPARLMIVALVALGLLARLALALMTSEGRASGLPESEEYLAIGGSVVAGEGFVLPGGSDVRPGMETPRPQMARRMPGYPLILAAAEALGTPTVRTALVFQALCGAATLLVVAWLAWRLAGAWAGVVATALMAFDPYQAYFAALVVPLAPLGLALAATAAGGIAFSSAAGEGGGGRRVWPRAAGAGLALAAATYLESWAVWLLAPALVAALVMKDRRRLLAGWGIMAAVVLAALAPWLVRNALCVGGPVLTTEAGHALYQGTAPEDGAPLPPEGLDELGRDVFYLKQAAGRIADAPGAWVRLAAGRIGRLWSPDPMWEGDVPLPALAGYTSLLPTGLLALGGVLALGRRAGAVVWLLPAAIGVTLVHLAAAGPAHERLAAMPTLAVLGGAAVAALLGRRGIADE